jgi:hypothetical protein
MSTFLGVRPLPKLHGSSPGSKSLIGGEYRKLDAGTHRPTRREARGASTITAETGTTPGDVVWCGTDKATGGILMDVASGVVLVRAGQARCGDDRGRGPVVPGQADIRQAVVQRGKAPAINVAIGADDGQTAAVVLVRVSVRGSQGRSIGYCVPSNYVTHRPA